VTSLFFCQPLQEENETSSGDEDDSHHGVSVGAIGHIQDEDDEEEEDTLVNNSSEQLDNIRFEDGQLVDGYNYR
jgi:hypothetical protein